MMPNTSPKTAKTMPVMHKLNASPFLLLPKLFAVKTKPTIEKIKEIEAVIGPVIDTIFTRESNIRFTSEKSQSLLINSLLAKKIKPRVKTNKKRVITKAIITHTTIINAVAKGPMPKINEIMPKTKPNLQIISTRRLM